MIRGILWWLLIATTITALEPADLGSRNQQHEGFHVNLGRWRPLFERGTHSTDSRKQETTSKHTGDDTSHLGPTLMLSAVSTTGSCDGSTTYYGGVPSTVYQTVTEGFDVTVADNATFTAQETIYTPPAACSFTVMPVPIVPSSSESGTITSGSIQTPPFNNFTRVPISTSAISLSHHPLPEGSTQSSQDRTNSNSPFTSPPGNVVTITVTKKTPVRKTPTKTTPQVQFPTDPPDNSPSMNTQSPNNPTTAPVLNPNTEQPNQSTHTSNPPNNPTRGPGNGPGTTQNANGPGTNNFPGNSPTGTGIGSIINSIFNSPFVPAVTSFGTAAPSVTLIHGVPVQVGPSSVWIGGQSVALPSEGQQTTVVVNGETFTVQPTAVVEGSSTLTIGRQQSISQVHQSLAIVPLPTSTITRNGITVTIGPSQAILSGTTYRIGPNAPATTVVVSAHGVNGADGGSKQTITFDSDGVEFPSTTYNPALTVVNSFVVTTIGAHITISIDMSEAVLSGTTYRIGSGATTTSSVVDGTTIFFGPSGVIVPGMTTVAPTSVDVTATGSLNSTPATKAGGSSASQTAGTSNAAALQRSDKILALGSVGLTLILLALGVLL